MKTPLNIHITAVERLLKDGFITKDEYENIMTRLIQDRIKEVKE